MDSAKRWTCPTRGLRPLFDELDGVLAALHEPAGPLDPQIGYDLSDRQDRQPIIGAVLMHLRAAGVIPPRWELRPATAEQAAAAPDWMGDDLVIIWDTVEGLDVTYKITAYRDVVRRDTAQEMLAALAVGEDHLNGQPSEMTPSSVAVLYGVPPIEED